MSKLYNHDTLGALASQIITLERMLQERDAEIARLKSELQDKYNQGYDAGHDAGYSLGQWGTVHDEEREYQKSRSLVERWKRFFSWL